jgi:acyl-coenzyme A thioesterase PaaI-like protein
MRTLGATLGTIAPGVVERIIARGRVVRPGRTLTLIQTEVLAESQGKEKLIALLNETMVSIEGREGMDD